MSPVVEGRDKVVAILVSLLPAWSDVDATSVQIELAGQGANSTVYRAAAPGKEPVAVKDESGGRSGKIGVHHGVGDLELALAKSKAFADVMADAGLGPRVLLRKEVFTVEEYCGECLPTGDKGCRSLEDSRLAGELLGRMHLLPTGWYEPFRARVLDLAPQLRVVPHDSPIWTISSATGVSASTGLFPQLLELSAEELQQFMALMHSICKPVTRTLSRIVSAHCDFHPGNVVKRSDGRLFVVDFEQCCVSGAWVDLIRAMDRWAGENGVEGKRAFVQGYLEATKSLGFDEAVDDVILDAECCFMHLRAGAAGRQLAQMIVDQVALGLPVEAGKIALAAIREARAQPATAGKRVIDNLPYGLSKEIRCEGDVWKPEYLYYRRLGRSERYMVEAFPGAAREQRF